MKPSDLARYGAEYPDIELNMKVKGEFSLDPVLIESGNPSHISSYGVGGGPAKTFCLLVSVTKENYLRLILAYLNLRRKRIDCPAIRRHAVARKLRLRNKDYLVINS